MSSAPTPYDRQSNFVTLSQGNGNITVSQIATQLDAEFDALNTSVDQTQARLAEVQRDDGGLAYQVVNVSSLAPDVLTLISTSAALFRGSWATGTAYTPSQIVVQGSSIYYCIVGHTSGTFATDLASAYWIPAGLADGSVTTPKLADGAVTAAKIDPSAKLGGATGDGTDRTFFENDQSVNTSYTITANKNAMSAGPITIANGVTLTVPNGSVYTVV